MKTLTALLLTIAIATSSFAITSAEKESFLSTVKSQVKSGSEFMDTVVATAQLSKSKAIAEWAFENTEEFEAWFDTLAWSMRNPTIWVIRKALNKSYDIYSLQDAVINDYGSTRDSAWENIKVYNVMKQNGFVFNNHKVSDDGIITLSLKRYSDPETAINFVSEKKIAENLKLVLVAIRKAKLSAEKQFRLLSKLAIDMAEYKDSVKAVKDNWEFLQNDKNEAFMAYYAEQKLNSLNK